MALLTEWSLVVPPPPVHKPALPHARPDDLAVHLILDNYATHKTPAIRRWLARRPRFHVHFTPTSASWLNLVERWFAALTEKQLRRGSHRSTSYGGRGGT